MVLSKARLFPASSNFAAVREKYRNDIFTTPAGSGVAVLSLIWIANLITTAKSRLLKNLLLESNLEQRFPMSHHFALNRENYSFTSQW